MILHKYFNMLICSSITFLIINNNENIFVLLHIFVDIFTLINLPHIVLLTVINKIYTYV